MLSEVVVSCDVRTPGALAHVVIKTATTYLREHEGGGRLDAHQFGKLVSNIMSRYLRDHGTDFIDRIPKTEFLPASMWSVIRKYVIEQLEDLDPEWAKRLAQHGIGSSSQREA